MKAEITYNGKTVDVELTSEQMKELGLQDSKKTGWEKVNINDRYYYISSCAEVRYETNQDDAVDRSHIKCGNYFSDKALAELMAKTIGLYLRMRRWADEHNTNDCTEDKYEIGYTNGGYWNTFYLSAARFPFAIYFSSEEIAKQALEKFEPELNEVFVNGLWHLGVDNND